MKNNQKIQAVFTLTSPLHISDPAPAAVGLDGKFADQGFPCIRTTTMPRLVDGELRYIPCVPANSMRKILRMHLLAQIEEQLAARAQPLTLNAYAAAACGAATGAPDGIQATYQERRDIAAHPYLGLFGGGPRMMHGKLSAGAALAITPDTLNLAAGYEHLAAGGKITAIQWIFRKDPLASVDSDIIAGGAEAISAAQAAALESKERGLAAMNCHQVVIPGVSMVFEAKLTDPTGAQLGALLSAIFALPSRPLGGKSSHGYGQVALQSVTLNGEEIASQGELDMDNTMANDAMTAWGEALETITAADLEAFAASQKAEKPKKKGKE